MADDARALISLRVCLLLKRQDELFVPRHRVGYISREHCVVLRLDIAQNRLIILWSATYLPLRQRNGHDALIFNINLSTSEVPTPHSTPQKFCASMSRQETRNANRPPRQSQWPAPATLTRWSPATAPGEVLAPAWRALPYGEPLEMQEADGYFIWQDGSNPKGTPQ